MNGPPFYPPYLLTLRGLGRKKLGDARFEVMGWTFWFIDGALRVSEPTGTNVVFLDEEATEQFVALVHALDAGRYTCADFAPRTDAS